MREPHLDSNPPILDALGRPLRSVRISVTDRCNLRCQYCMPEEDYAWLPRKEVLSFEEIAQLADLFIDFGVRKIRLTGGEPLLRHNLPELVRLLAAGGRLQELALTTNGLLLARFARDLRDAGLQRINVSLDTLQSERFFALTKTRSHAAVLEGLNAAREAGFINIKVNSVIVRHFNDDEVADLVAFGRRESAEVRFIEYMDVGGATRWSMDQVVPAAEIVARVEKHFGPASTEPAPAGAPAQRFRLADGTVFGVIASTTQPFCKSCDRGRLTLDGVWFQCLYATRGINLKALLRGGASREVIANAVARAWQARTDRGAEWRRQLPERGVLFPVAELRKDPHREMHTRGG